MPSAFLHPFTAPTADDFVVIVEGEAAVVRDREGRDYVDGMASLWYCNVGHGRAEIADAVAAQLRRLSSYHTFERFTNEPAEAVTAALAGLAPFPGARVFLTTSGSEAVDTAVKLARMTADLGGEPQRTIIVSREPSYHGMTYGGTTATGLPASRAHVGPLLPDVEHVPHGDAEALRAVFDDRGDRVAAFLAEPVVGAGGVWPPAPGYLRTARELCDEHGALLVLDEVICGFGRLGAWWGADRYGVVPDLVTFAKGVTSGYQPLGGVLLSRRVLDVLESAPDFVLRHGHTYSGHPAACAAASANLAIIEREGLLDRSLKVGQRLASGLESLVDGERITGVRGDGAVWAAALGDGVAAPAVREAMLERGVIARPIGTSTIAFAPPLVIEEDQIDRCVDALAGAVDAVTARGGGDR